MYALTNICESEENNGLLFQKKKHTHIHGSNKMQNPYFVHTHVRKVSDRQNYLSFLKFSSFHLSKS